ncbi:MAG: hypothetical protein LBB75_06425 [Oscillospiraceae bacterium]|jgi:hypothetical protein|nr:hypothetical protein [Oscillospiraceae bacterium]
MFYVLAALPLAFAATAFAVVLFCVAAGVTLAAMAVQFFLVRYKSRRAGLVLPVIALCACTLPLLGGLLAALSQGAALEALLTFLPALLTGNIPAILLLLERRIILKWMRKKGLYATGAAR